MSDEKYSMVQECTDSYRAEEQPDGSLEVRIKVPKRFADLWIVKLSELQTTMDEIRAYEPEDAEA